MANYEARIIRGAGLLNLVISLDCNDDPAALQKARLLVDTHDVEVWRDCQIVGTLHHHPSDGAEPPPENVVSLWRR